MIENPSELNKSDPHQFTVCVMHPNEGKTFYAHVFAATLEEAIAKVKEGEWAELEEVGLKGLLKSKGMAILDVRDGSVRTPE